MMRRTATCAGLALALFLTSWIPLGAKPAKVKQAISFDGIDVVVLQGNAADVDFTSSQQGATYDPLEISALGERRKGRVLVIYPPEGNHSGYDVRLPPTIRRLQVEGGSIEVGDGVDLPQLVVRTSNDLNWTGDVARLDIIDTSERRRGDDCEYCGPAITVHGGDINELRISSGFHQVAIGNPDDVRRLTLFLGPDARYSMGLAKRQPDLRIRPWQPGIIHDLPPDTDLP